jgi:hypothetical protein
MNDTDAQSKICPACYGQGFEPWMQTVRPGAKLYPILCQKCGSTGRKPMPVPLVSKIGKARHTSRGV